MAQDAAAPKCQCQGDGGAGATEEEGGEGRWGMMNDPLTLSPETLRDVI